MKFRAAENDDRPFEVTAMVDVVFILLAFFVLTVRFTGGEADLPVGYTSVNEASGASNDDLPSEILVRLRPGDGGVWIAVGESVLPENGYDELTALLKQIDVPELPVVLAADAGLPIQDVARAMDAVLASPMKTVSLGSLGGVHADAPEASP